MKQTILSHINLSDAEYDLLLHIGKLKTVPRKTVLFREGEVSSKILFVDQGLMRAFRYQNGNEYTHFFFAEKWFATDFKSYLTQAPGELYIESLTETTYYEFDKEEFTPLFAQHPQFERLGRIIAEKAYLLMVDRIEAFQLHTLTERYLKLTQQNPDLFLQVPQKYIATYLGVSEQSLSRIKAATS